MINLNNDVNLDFQNSDPKKLGSILLKPFGEGSGMLGLPGDFTPVSRFVRAAAYSQAIGTKKTGYDSVLQAFHVLNNFDIPKGAIREKDPHGNTLNDFTQWTSANDLKSKTFYIRPHENRQIHSLNCWI